VDEKLASWLHACKKNTSTRSRIRALSPSLSIIRCECTPCFGGHPSPPIRSIHGLNVIPSMDSSRQGNESWVNVGIFSPLHTYDGYLGSVPIVTRVYINHSKDTYRQNRRSVLPGSRAFEERRRRLRVSPEAAVYGAQQGAHLRVSKLPLSLEKVSRSWN
jgi:hypothetical protein